MQMVPKQDMSKHHLSDSDRAAPANVVIDTDFELAFIAIVLYSR